MQSCEKILHHVTQCALLNEIREMALLQVCGFEMDGIVGMMVDSTFCLLTLIAGSLKNTLTWNTCVVVN